MPALLLESDKKKVAAWLKTSRLDTGKYVFPEKKRDRVK